MDTLAPIVNQMRDLARTELPDPQTCQVRLWDDGTFDIVIYHSLGEGERQQLTYERTTGEILWEHLRGARLDSTSLTGGETIHTPAFDQVQVRVLATVDPPSE